MISVSEPNDGWDTIERLLLREIILNIYRNIVCPIGIINSSDSQAIFKYRKQVRDLQNAFIFMAVNESGYTQEEVAAMLDITQVAIHKRLKKTTGKVRDRGL